MIGQPPRPAAGAPAGKSSYIGRYKARGNGSGSGATAPENAISTLRESRFASMVPPLQWFPALR